MERVRDELEMGKGLGLRGSVSDLLVNLEFSVLGLKRMMEWLCSP